MIQVGLIESNEPFFFFFYKREFFLVGGREMKQKGPSKRFQAQEGLTLLLALRLQGSSAKTTDRFLRADGVLKLTASKEADLSLTKQGIGFYQQPK